MSDWNDTPINVKFGPPTPEELYSELDADRSFISDLKIKIKLIEEQIQDVKDRSRKHVAHVLSTYDDEQRLSTATTLYWLHEDLINAATIGDVLGVPVNFVGRTIGAASMRLICRDCNQEKDYQPTSRSDAQMHRDGIFVCEDCKQARKDNSVKELREWTANIEHLRTMPYTEYLKTEHWQVTRNRALKRANFKCQVCNTNQRQLHVHHRTYVNRGDEQNADLIVLCADCHQTFHDNGKVQS